MPYTHTHNIKKETFLGKDPTVWLDGARPAKTCIPPSFQGNAYTEPSCIPTPKNIFASINKLAVKIVKSYVRMIYNSATILTFQQWRIAKGF
jgi:hypothetical protein